MSAPALDLAYGSPEWVAERQHYIGASDVAAVLGLDPYRSPLDVWAQKTGRATDTTTSQAAKMGHLLEPVVAELAQEAYLTQALPHTVRLKMVSTREGRTPWQRATPDRLVQVVDPALPRGAFHERIVDEYLLEIKTKSWQTFKAFGQPGTDEVPDGVLLQAVWQLDVMALDRCDVAVLVDGRDFVMYTVRRDQALADDVFERVHDWRERYIVADVEPPVSRASDVEYLRRKFARHGDELLTPTLEVEEAVTALAAAKRAAKAAEEQEALAKARVMELLGTAKGVHCAAGKVSWSTTKGRASTNWQAIAETMGAPVELIQQHTTIGAPARVFRLTLKGD